MRKKRYNVLLFFLITVVGSGLYFYGDIVLFILVYFSLFLIFSFRALQTSARKRTRTMLVITYLTVMIVQIAFYTQVLADDDLWSNHPLRKLIAVLFLLLPIIISYYVTVDKHAELYLPSFHETATISFSQARALTKYLTQTVSTLKKNGKSLSPDNFRKIITDLPRHDSFRYINAGSLTEEYFNAAKAASDDHGLYIIISNTGTPQSEFISVFTGKEFNHVSIAFDAGLQTIVSYNGGERVYPPGMNREMLEFFCKKDDASILIYRLPVTYEQKQTAIEKISQINTEGSAYNLLGIFIGRSHKPNIMYCSQFVFNLLKHIGADFFEPTGSIKPTDFVEKDYFRKLEFIEELRLSK